ncbi:MULTISPECIES: acyl carrier protein [Helicobacter]|uniref:Acyl carrier protein n=1 Tax=Helicobacter ganmani TaxID=60246 RepID=A0A3D8ICR8_9HELI|nr:MULTISPECIES: acyl carrier protein [Helicobacter]RDU62331.1 acyl carrier protein [Helicobacter ganmani]
MNDLEVILQEIVAEIDLSSPDFIGDGFLDSFALMSLIGALEQSYHISIFDEEVEIQDYRSLESIKNLLRKKGVKI